MPGINWEKLTGENNPVKDLRDQLAMSRQAISKATELSYNTYVFTEAGTVGNISDKLHDFFYGRFNNYDKDKIIDLYNYWIVNSRRQISLPPVAEEISSDANSNHPFDQYINSTSYTINGFCTAIKVPKYPVYHYIKPGMQCAMPASIATALKQCGMSDNDLLRLDALGVSHYNNVLKKRINERHGYDNNGTGKLAS